MLCFGTFCLGLILGLLLCFIRKQYIKHKYPFQPRTTKKYKEALKEAREILNEINKS